MMLRRYRNTPAAVETLDADGPFDPSKHKVDEVNAYLADADEAERDRVLEAEQAGKDRATVSAPAGNPAS